jgi:hypothetical protein
MPYLGDYLGHLLSEITTARVQADLETVRVAELYASHPLLKHLPVPHFRLPMVTVEVPVAIKEMEEAKGDSPRGGVLLPNLIENFHRLLEVHLERARIKLPDAQRVTLSQALNETISRLAQPPYVSTSVTYIADELVSTATEFLSDLKGEKGAIEQGQIEKVLDELKAAARLEFLNLRTLPPRLHVLVTTAELREAGPHEVLARLHLSISEEAVEWSLIESEGRAHGKLVPE